MFKNLEAKPASALRVLALAAVSGASCTAALAQAIVAPGLTPDASQAARQRAMAKVMTVAPTYRSRDEATVVRETGPGSKTCTMNIAPLPNQREGASKLGTVNQTVVVEGTPVLACGR